MQMDQHAQLGATHVCRTPVGTAVEGRLLPAGAPARQTVAAAQSGHFAGVSGTGSLESSKASWARPANKQLSLPMQIAAAAAERQSCMVKSCALQSSQYSQPCSISISLVINPPCVTYKGYQHQAGHACKAAAHGT